MTAQKDLIGILQRIKSVRVLCVGDAMLDRFIYGRTERISREAPVPIMIVEHEKSMPGGAGNTVSNIAALGAQALLVSATGQDVAGEKLESFLAAKDVLAYITRIAGRPTTVKERYVSGNQQMLRVDYQIDTSLPEEDEAKIICAVQDAITTAHAVILSDYGTGIFAGGNVLRAVITAAHAKGIPVVVDPRGNDFKRYRGAFAITPNRSELEAGSGLKAESDSEVRAAAEKIIASCGIETVLATRGKDGMALIRTSEEPLHIPAQVREVYDVSGAGDTVIAVFTCALAAGADPASAAHLANIAAGIVVGKAGTATVSPAEIEAVYHESSTAKIVSREAAASKAAEWRERGARVGFTNGTFDLLHPGHLSSIRQAKAQCDRLIVGLNSDASVKRYKGEGRPIQGEQSRAAVLEALEMVDLVVIFEEDTPVELMKAIRPDVVVKGAQYKIEDLPGADFVLSYGGKIVLADMSDGYSTTNTVKKIKEPPQN